MALDVLIVDDSMAIRKILHRALQQAAVPLGKVMEAGDGTEALEALKNQKVGLILSDINMPKMDGLQFLRLLKADSAHCDVPVVMVTTEGSQSKVIAALNIGATGYIRKPFTPEQIKEKLAGIGIIQPANNAATRRALKGVPGRGGNLEHEYIVSHILESTLNVFSTMLGLELVPGPPRACHGFAGPGTGVVSLVGMVGSRAGTGSVGCSAPLACRIANALFLSEYESVNDDVLDGMGEVANMIIGNIKTSIEEMTGPMGLGIPTVVYGRNFTTRSQKGDQWSVVPFDCGGEELLVQLMLVPHGVEIALTQGVSVMGGAKVHERASLE